MICDNVKNILAENKIFAKKNYGQNFLIDKNVLQKIIAIAKVSSEDTVLEIGPGLGCLTEYLALNCKKVIAYEIDINMVNILQDTLKAYSNVEIRYLDFMNANLEEFDQMSNVKVVANLPYYITTAIISKLLTETKISSYIFMVQKEVAQRITGKPNTKDYNALSVLMDYQTISEMKCFVSPNCFYPAPKVESALIDVKRKQSDYKPKNELNFVKFIYNIFSQRRKTILNNINNQYSIKKEIILEKLNNLKIKENVRAEELTTLQIFNLYSALFEEQEL